MTNYVKTKWVNKDNNPRLFTPETRRIVEELPAQPSYRSAFRKYIKFCNQPFEEIKTEDTSKVKERLNGFKEYLKDEGLLDTTVRSYCNYLSIIYCNYTMIEDPLTIFPYNVSSSQLMKRPNLIFDYNLHIFTPETRRMIEDSQLKYKAKSSLERYVLFTRTPLEKLILESPEQMTERLNGYGDMLHDANYKTKTIKHHIEKIAEVYRMYSPNVNMITSIIPEKWMIIRRTPQHNKIKRSSSHRRNMIKHESSDSDRKLIRRFEEERNIKPSTCKGYDVALSAYHYYCKYDLEYLINEALKEQDERVPPRKSKLKKRLLAFREYLASTKMGVETQKTYLSKVETFYRHFEVEIPHLPQISYKTEYVTSYTDLPTRSQLEKVLQCVNLQLRAVILFQVSSGSAKAETLSLKVSQFIEGIQDYTDKRYDGTVGSLKDMLKSLNFLTPDIVPTFYLKRIKTKKYYYTFCSPEAAEAITRALLQRINCCTDSEQLLEEQLFPFSSSLLLTRYQEINDSMGWGFKGKYRFFRSHVLRKYNASNIGMVSDDIDSIQGRSKNKVHEAYIKTNPQELKGRYKKHMWRVAVSDVWRDKMLVFDKEHMREYNVTPTDEKIANKIISTLNLSEQVINPEPPKPEFTQPVTPPSQQQPQTINNQGGNGVNPADELLKYAELQEKGLLSMDEFNRLKKKLLGGII